jgi:hypothetical protein
LTVKIYIVAEVFAAATAIIENRGIIIAFATTWHDDSHDWATPGRDKDNEVGGSLVAEADDLIIFMGGTTPLVLANNRHTWDEEDKIGMLE